jgi:N-acetylneuraminic acid mutarotase
MSSKSTFFINNLQGKNMKTKLFFAFFAVLIALTINLSAQDNRDMNLYNTLELQRSNVPTFTDNTALTTATWTTLTASPHAVSRSGAVYFRRNDTAYIYQFGGGSGAQYTNVARYNITTATWTNNVTTMPSSISAGSGVAYGDSVIFIFGGESAAGLGKCLKWNVVTNTWTTMAPMPTVPCTDQLTVKYQDTLVYCIGGGSGLFEAVLSNTVRLYNMKQNTWTTATALPIAKTMVSGGIYRDTIIVGPAWTGAAGTNIVHKGVINPANPTSITWTTVANFPAGNVTRSASGTVVKGTGVGVVITGGAVDGGATLSAATHIWNFCTQTWQSLPNNTLARSNYKGSAGDSSLWCPGGYTTAGVGQFDRITFSLIDGTCGIVGISVNENGVPTGYGLAQNYPNPFNPTTTFSYGIPVTGMTKLVVTDVLGREVAVLVNEQKTAGIYNVNFDASRLSSGIYFYTLSSGSFKETKKMLLVK